jgi:hypothetical protein
MADSSQDMEEREGVGPLYKRERDGLEVVGAAMF